MEEISNNIKISSPVLANSAAVTMNKVKINNTESSLNNELIVELGPQDKVSIKANNEQPLIEKQPKEAFQVKFGDADSPGIKFQVIDKASGEIVRQYPFRSVLDTAEKPKEENLKLGLLVDVSI